MKAVRVFFRVALHAQVPDDEPHRRHHRVLHLHGVRAVEAVAGLGLLQDRKHVAVEVLLIVDVPAAVNPMTQLEHLAKLVRLAR